MTVLFMLPVAMSSLLISAHLWRAGIVIPALICLAVPFTLFIKARWPVMLNQALLVAAALEWVRTLWYYIQIYQDIGRPWGRLAIILVCVIVFTLLSLLVFRAKRLRMRYGLYRRVV